MSTKIFGDDADPDDRMAARLRDALTSEAAMVTPSDDGLQHIRAGIDDAGRRSWWRHPAAPALAAALVLGLMAGGIAVLVGGDDGKDDAIVGTTGSPTTEASTPEPSETTTPSESGTPTPVPVEGKVYVYYVMDDGQSLRLYREGHPSGPVAAESPVFPALAEMMSRRAEDPDYSSIWPKGTEVRDLEVTGDVASVDVSDFPAVGAGAEAVAVQQLVYTVTANDKRVKKVKLLVNGGTPPSGHQDWSKPVARAPMVDVQGLIWLLAPTEGATVSSPVEISGYGTAFEGTISWEVRLDGQKVAAGSTQGGPNGDFGDFSDTVDLDPGTYEIRAFESSAEDGRPLHVDTKTVTVR